MSREFKAGDVVSVGVDDSTPRLALVRLRSESYGGRLEVAYASGGYDMLSDRLLDVTVRPLVVIDPEDREQVERLLRGYGNWANESDDGIENYPQYVDSMQAALRSIVTPPRPPEPRGLGAVVEADGRVWVRTPKPNPDSRSVWNDGISWVTYDDLSDVRVLDPKATP